MQYLSPATFFGEALPVPLDKKAIQLGRKKLFAELELGGGSTIELHNRQLTRNDIIQYFENLLKEDALSYHNAIGEDPVLLRFLEDAIIGRKEMFQNNPLYEDERFIHWVSPYFCHSFLAFMTTCFLVEPDEDGLVSLLVNNHLMTPEDLEKGWEAVIRILMDDISTLEQYHAQRGGNAAFGQIEYLMEFRYMRLIKLLPLSRFASIRDKYAHCMLNACIVTFNKYNQHRETVKTWLENAELLAVSEEIKAVINDKIRELEAIHVPAAEKERGSSPLKFIVIAVIILVRLATCKHDSSSSSYYRSTPAFYPQNTPWTRQRILDSIKREYPHLELEKTGVAPMDTVTVTHKINRDSRHK